MSYKSIINSTILSFSLLFCINTAIAQGPDSVYYVPNNPFLTYFLSKNDLNVSVQLSVESKIIPVEGTLLAPNMQMLLKNGKDIYVIIEQSGFTYKLTSYDSITCKFTRIDHTVNLNYNINCINFFYNNQLFSYGGYGFWKSNGHLRKFNFEDSEWDIIPLNDEIIGTNYIWYSSDMGRLYVPIQRVINAGIAGPEYIRGVPQFSSYYLDLNAHKWVKLGELSSDAKLLIKDDYTSESFLNIKDGLLHLVQDDLYYFDYVHNKIYKSKNSNLNQFLIRRASLTNMFVDKGFIYSYNVGSKAFVKYPFKISDFELLRTSIWGVESQLYYIFVSVIFAVLVVILAVWYFNRSVKRKLEVEQLKILKTKSVSQAFTGTEVSLIQLLLAATLKSTTLEIHQINHVLGIKDKNIGLQKKVRSDVMNAINDKYEFITQSNAMLIGSSRKEDDKRFFEYFINPTEIKAIQRILENN